MEKIQLRSILIKTAIVHTVTYSFAGILSYNIMDYTSRFADPVVSSFMRQTNDPWIAAGPFFQIFRGLLFGFVFYALREIVLERKNGWMILWMTLVIVGIFSTFGAAPGSIEGAIYTLMPVSFQLIGLPEVILQALALSWTVHYWTNHTDKKWISWVLGIFFTVAILMSFLGVLAALGILKVPAQNL